MPRALSVDLRSRLVNACQAGEKSQREIADLFQVGHSTVEKLWRQWRTSGTVAPKPHAGGPSAHLAAVHDELRRWVRENPDTRLAPMVVRLQDQLGIRTSFQTLSRTLLRLGLRRKKDARRQRTHPTGRGRRA